MLLTHFYPLDQTLQAKGIYISSIALLPQLPNVKIVPSSHIAPNIQLLIGPKAGYQIYLWLTKYVWLLVTIYYNYRHHTHRIHLDSYM